MRWNDSRDETTKTRENIGFIGLKNKWRQAEANFESGTLKICDHPVMEDWEDGYMKTLAEIATAQHGCVLEVGFGLGISASYVQQNDIAEHVIIEANEGVFRKLEEFGAHAEKTVRPLFGFWEDITPSFSCKMFDGILFDTYPLTSDGVHRNHFDFFSEAYRLLKTGGRLTYYSDEPKVISAPHLKALEDAGFRRDKIGWSICKVNPPENCQYWRASTIVAPIIQK